MTIGGEAYLFELAKDTPSTSNISAYVICLNDRTQRRKLREIGEAVIKGAGAVNVEREIASIQQKLLTVRRVSDMEELTAYSLRDFLVKEIKPRSLLLAPWLPEQGLAMIYAKRGVGKTYVGLNVAYAVASGGEFLGWKASKASNVLYIDGEMPASTIQDRLSKIVKAHAREVTANFSILTPDMQKNGMPDLSTIEGQRQIESHIEKADLIVIDNISTLCRKIDENKADDWLPVQAWALRMRTMGKSVIFIHHASKNGGQRGTSKREDVLDTVIVLRHPIDYDPQDGAKFEVSFEKSRGFTGKDAESFLASLITDEHGIEQWVTKTIERSNYERVIILHNDGLSNNEIAEDLGIHKSNVSRSLKRAKEEGLLHAKA